VAAGADTEGVCAGAVAGVTCDGVDVTGDVTTGLTVTGGAVVGGGVLVVTGGVGVGVGVAPGTVTVTGETPGVVLADRRAAGAIAAPLGTDSTANVASNATVDSAPTTIRRRVAALTVRLPASRRSLALSSRNVSFMRFPLPPRFIAPVSSRSHLTP
jgi:hypothetical protein